MNDQFSMNLQETDASFQREHGTSTLGGAFAGIVTNNHLFESYADSITEGFKPADKVEIMTLLENTRNELLRESTMSNISPFASLTMPILVKLWARLSMTKALPTEPIDVPAFTVSYLKPYIMGADGEKYYLPESINAPQGELTGKRHLTPEIKLTDSRLVDYDLFTGLTTADRSRQDSVDRKFSIIGATWSDSFNKETKALGEVALTNRNIIKLDTSDNLYGEITYQVDATGKTETDTILGHVNLAKATITLSSVSGKLKGIRVLGFVSSEQHTAATQVGVEMTKQEIQVGTAEHIEATFPVEFLEDIKAMYSIDGTATVVEHMSNITQQRVDEDIIAFLEQSYKSTGGVYSKQFDVNPSSDFAIQPFEWRKGLRTVLDYMAQSMRNDHKNYDARFVVVGNPIDTMLLDDVQWSTVGGETQVNGIDVQYSVGAITGQARYSIISSDLIPMGALKLIAIPTRQDYKTYTYYPYSFNVVSNYNNSQNHALPNIMMTKRYTIEEFNPIIGEIQILHNDATQYAR